MWNSIENWKQNLNKIALDVHDDDEELEIYGDGDDSSVSDRRHSHSFAHSKSFSPSPIPNGNDSPYRHEIEQCRAEIRRLQESESEIKALSVNYAALLKDKEDQICRLNQENGSLKQSLDATKEALNVSRAEILRAPKGNGDQSRQYKPTAQGKNRFAGNQLQNGTSNGSLHAVQPTMNSPRKDKELADLLEEKSRSLEAMQSTHELQMKQLNTELGMEHDKLAHLQQNLQEERNLNQSLHAELQVLKMDKHKHLQTSMDMSKMQSELNEKTSEIRRLQMELVRSGEEDAADSVQSLKRVIVTLEKENTSLKIAKNELEASLEKSRNSSPKQTSPDVKADSSETFPGKKEMELSLQKMERDLKEARHGREKALQELARLKQHLLEKESEESEKMDEDSKIIEELRERNEYQKAQISHLEKALNQAIASQEEVRMSGYNELQKYKDTVEDLNKKLANCVNVIDSKNVELLNLQTALGQYFAEIEAREHLEQQLGLVREESAKLSEHLKGAEQGIDALKREKEELLAKLSQAEKMLGDGKNRVNKLEEDNSKLRRVVEQSMTRLNRMSMDSDYLVDRRIVIKLLVTYFQRNHSKEVLDLMVRMLGFSDEDKQRIGVAEQGGRGVVRGVLGLPGRLVGGILGGSSADAHANASENQNAMLDSSTRLQSFADMWVDFLLKETEEREKRGSTEDAGRPSEDLRGRSQSAAGVSPQASNHRTSSGSPVSAGFPKSSFSQTHKYSPPSSQGNSQPLAHSDSEFSTGPLTSALLGYQDYLPRIDPM